MASRREILMGAAVALWTACIGRADDDAPLPDDPPDDGDSGTAPTGCQPAHTARTGSGWIELPLSEHPELGSLYSGKRLSIDGTPVNVAQVAEGCFVAMGTVCTHEGCAVDYAAERNQFTCPCHGALYGIDGVPIAGPAPFPLPLHDVDFDGSSVWVRLIEEA